MLAILAAVAGIALIWMLAQRWFATFIQNAAIDAWIVVVVMAAHTAVSIVRRKAHLHDARAQSWLAPLPHRLSERSRLIAQPAIEIAILALLLGIACFIGPLDFRTAKTLVLAALAGAALGTVVSFLMTRATKRTTEDWRYAIVRQPRAEWASNPRLSPLSYWPIAQGRAQFNPRVISQTVAPVLLAIPLGTGGQTVIALVAAWVIALYVLSLFLATVRSAFAAARWLAPTPLSLKRLLMYLSYRALGMQLLTVILVVLALTALGRHHA